MSDQPAFDSLNPYNYEFQKAEQPEHQLDPIVNTSSNFKSESENYHYPYTGLDSLKISNPQDSLGFSSSFNVVEETISPTKDQEWDIVKREVEKLRTQIIQKTQFYTNLKNRFIETQQAWQQEKKGLLAEISLIKASKDNELLDQDKQLANSSAKTLSIQQAEIIRLQQQISLKESAWNQQKNVLVNELSSLRVQINRISLIHRKQGELSRHIQIQNQQISQMARQIHEGRRRQETHIVNINRLSAEVQRLSLVHQKTNAMELQLQKLNLELTRWYQKGDKIEGVIEDDFSKIASEENIKFLQKRVYILETANYNLSEEIKRNRQTITAHSKSEQIINQLKIDLIKSQIQSQNSLKQVQLLRQQISQKQKERKEKPKRKKKTTLQEVKAPNMHNLQTVIKYHQNPIQHAGMHPQQTIHPIVLVPNHILKHAEEVNNYPIDIKIKKLRQQTQSLKNSLRQFE